MATIKCGIYIIRNKINGKVYIGQSVDITRRWWEHKSRAFDLNNNCFHKPLYQAFRKYGIENFELNILCECAEEELNKEEAKYIKQFNSLVPNGYNILESSDKEYTKKDHCIKCGKVISRQTQNHLCRDCYCLSIRTVERPSREELKIMIRTLPFTKIGKKYNISDNGIRKWCQDVNLPYKKKEIKSYSDEEWELI